MPQFHLLSRSLVCPRKADGDPCSPPRNWSAEPRHRSHPAPACRGVCPGVRPGHSGLSWFPDAEAPTPTWVREVRSEVCFQRWKYRMPAGVTPTTNGLSSRVS